MKSGPDQNCGMQDCARKCYIYPVGSYEPTGTLYVSVTWHHIVETQAKTETVTHTYESHSTLGTSDTKLVVSELYARVSLPMRSIECSKCLREVLYTYIVGSLTNTVMCGH